MKFLLLLLLLLLQVRINENNTGAVKFVNSAFWGPTNSIAVVGCVSRLHTGPA
jgi:hypothetical protein